MDTRSAHWLLLTCVLVTMTDHVTSTLHRTSACFNYGACADMELSCPASNSMYIVQAQYGFRPTDTSCPRASNCSDPCCQRGGEACYLPYATSDLAVLYESRGCWGSTSCTAPAAWRTGGCQGADNSSYGYISSFASVTYACINNSMMADFTTTRKVSGSELTLSYDAASGLPLTTDVTFYCHVEARDCTNRGADVMLVKEANKKRGSVCTSVGVREGEGAGIGRGDWLTCDRRSMSYSVSHVTTPFSVYLRLVAANSAPAAWAVLADSDGGELVVTCGNVLNGNTSGRHCSDAATSTPSSISTTVLQTSPSITTVDAVETSTLGPTITPVRSPYTDSTRTTTTTTTTSDTTTATSDTTSTVSDTTSTVIDTSTTSTASSSTTSMGNTTSSKATQLPLVSTVPRGLTTPAANVSGGRGAGSAGGSGTATTGPPLPSVSPDKQGLTLGGSTSNNIIIVVTVVVVIAFIVFVVIVVACYWRQPKFLSARSESETALEEELSDVIPTSLLQAVMSGGPTPASPPRLPSRPAPTLPLGHPPRPPGHGGQRRSLSTRHPQKRVTFTHEGPGKKRANRSSVPAHVLAFQARELSEDCEYNHLRAVTSRADVTQANVYGHLGMSVEDDVTVYSYDRLSRDRVDVIDSPYDVAPAGTLVATSHSIAKNGHSSSSETRGTTQAAACSAAVLGHAVLDAGDDEAALDRDRTPRLSSDVTSGSGRASSAHRMSDLPRYEAAVAGTVGEVPGEDASVYSLAGALDPADDQTFQLAESVEVERRQQTEAANDAYEDDEQIFGGFEEVRRLLAAAKTMPGPSVQMSTPSVDRRVKASHVGDVPEDRDEIYSVEKPVEVSREETPSKSGISALITPDDIYSVEKLVEVSRQEIPSKSATSALTSQDEIYSLAGSTENSAEPAVDWESSLVESECADPDYYNTLELLKTRLPSAQGHTQAASSSTESHEAEQPPPGVQQPPPRAEQRLPRAEQSPSGAEQSPPRLQQSPPRAEQPPSRAEPPPPRASCLPQGSLPFVSRLVQEFEQSTHPASSPSGPPPPQGRPQPPTRLPGPKMGRTTPGPTPAPQPAPLGLHSGPGRGQAGPQGRLPTPPGPGAGGWLSGRSLPPTPSVPSSRSGSKPVRTALNPLAKKATPGTLPARITLDSVVPTSQAGSKSTRAASSDSRSTSTVPTRSLPSGRFTTESQSGGTAAHPTPQEMPVYLELVSPLGPDVPRRAPALRRHRRQSDPVSDVAAVARVTSGRRTRDSGTRRLSEGQGRGQAADAVYEVVRPVDVSPEPWGRGHPGQSDREEPVYEVERPVKGGNSS